MRKRAAYDALIDTSFWLETLLTRLRGGEDIYSASRALPRIQVPAEFADIYTMLREKAEAGTLSATAAVESFAAYLSREIRFHDLLRKQVFMPKAQALVTGCLGLGLFVACHFLLEERLRPRPLDAGLSVVLLAAGMAWMRHQCARFERSLWFLTWIQFWTLAQLRLRSGGTLATFLGETQSGALTARWPDSLKRECHRFREETRSQSFGEIPVVAPGRDRDENRAHLQLEILRGLYRKGLPLSDALTELLAASLGSFERELELSASKLSLRMLLPLFFCFLPAFLILLLSPLIRLCADGLS